MLSVLIIEQASVKWLCCKNTDRIRMALVVSQKGRGWQETSSLRSGSLNDEEKRREGGVGGRRGVNGEGKGKGGGGGEKESGKAGDVVTGAGEGEKTGSTRTAR